MTEEQVTNDAEPQNVADAPVSEVEALRRERSTIQFPYVSLEDAASIARMIHKHAGTSCTIDQLAAYTRQSVTSGAFRIKVGNAGMFGFTESERGTVALTDLGRALVDPEQEAEAKAEGFMRVPLYARIYDHYKGYTLPPAAALERFMREVGVSGKQTDKARQALVRSARDAGYFAHGEDRLVRPAGPGTKPIEGGRNQSDGGSQGKRNGNGSGGDEPPHTHHPFVAGLIKELPPTGDPWPLKKQELWLETARSIFKMIYPTQDDEAEAAH